MKRYPYAAGLAIAGASSLAIFAGPAGAWDDLPCGATEDTAHVCAPGEVARNGTIPVPLPIVAPVVLAPTPAPVPPVPEVGVVIIPPAQPKVTKPQKPRLTCAKLLAEGAGVRWLVKFRCRTKLPGPFSPVVTGERR